MPRSLEHIHRELVRVAKELGVEDPRSREFTRSKFLNHGQGELLLTETSSGHMELDPSTPRPTDVTKHDLEVYGGFAKLKYDAAHTCGIPNMKQQPEARGVELRNLYVRKLERAVATQDYFHKKVDESLRSVFESNPIRVPKSSFSSSRKKKDRLLTLLWSDLHFGVEVKDYEVYDNRYTWQIASRRLAKLCVEAVEWFPDQDTRDRTELRVVLNGDIMQGVIHLNDANIRPMTEQIWGTVSILTHALSFLRQFYPKLKVVCLPGNHDRMTYRGPGRATCQRWDSHAHSVYLSLLTAFQGDPGVEFDIPTTGIALLDDFNDGLVLVTHGDTEPDPKNVSKKIDTESLANQLLQIKEVNSIRESISVAMFGHWHTPTIQMLPNGSFMVVNGALIGAEPFGQNAIGVWGNQPSQVIYEAMRGDPFYRHAVCKVKSADSNPSLDDVVPTPKIIENGQLVL